MTKSRYRLASSDRCIKRHYYRNMFIAISDMKKVDVDCPTSCYFSVVVVSGIFIVYFFVKYDKEC